ncbi:type I secretion system permease/ATPase [Lysobacter antibioticus]|uniref:type I secretion system permease/ATPase n=1 Tax=Lysobacter antibioticus TaxID=84531 RepID=UPI000689E0DF|nr:type I secretion system permease/ATPase [Lysobacter antibioticus]
MANRNEQERRPPDELASALGCCRLLLRLAKGRDQDPDYAVATTELKRAVLHYGEVHGTSLALSSVRYRKLSSSKVPLAFRAKGGGYQVLLGLSPTQGLVLCPGDSAPQVVTNDQLQADWTGEVIRILDSSLKFDIRWFIPEFIRHRRLLGEVLLISLILQLLALAAPLLFQVVMDKVLVHKALSTLDILAASLIVVGLWEVVLTGLREYLFTHTTNRIDIALGVKLFRHVLGLPLMYFKSRQIGTIIARVQQLEGIRNFLTGSMLTLCVDVIFTFVFFYVMARLSWTLTLVVLAGLPFYLALAYASTRPLQKRIERQFQAAAMNKSLLNESVRGVETIKSMAVEPRMLRRWESQAAEAVEAGFHTQTLNSSVSHGVVLLQKVVAVGIIWVGASMVTSLELTIGQLIAFSMMASHVNAPIAKLIELWQQFVQARVAVEKLGDMLNLPAEQEQVGLRPENPIIGSLRIRGLVFRYQPDSEPVLKGVNLDINAGESIGIVGPSGSGKSTLAHLLQKLHSPDEGEIHLDGIPLHQMDTKYLRSQIGVVQQESYLFNRSVRHNIAIRDAAASLDDVAHAAKLAGAHDFILQLPFGYDTVLAEAGSSLSGGQRQRVAIARALMANPRVLIFDEATSALDDESQAVIQENMAEIARGRTVITIAHRLSAVRRCDRIVTLEQGRVTEIGSHEELLVRGGCYARLYELQRAFGGTGAEDVHESH